ncbi:MAG: zinc ABC transporter substrate-binding protein [Bacteroidales bacterium]|nr:zinc ABC transporter substrate-binding protein [Bacteroidales bacterium]
MKKLSVWLAFIALAAVSCGPRNTPKGEERTVTVTIPPFAWFVEQIAGGDFRVNVLLPPGADHHIWEPLPAQISALSGSEAFIINGQLSFEHAWMERFLQVNPGMKVLDLSRNIRLIGSENLGSGDLGSEGLRAGEADEAHEGHQHEGDESHEGHAHEGHAQEDHAQEDHAHSHGGPDPHYWMSPVAARVMAKDIRDLLAGLNPSGVEKYNANLSLLERKISEIDSLVRASLDDNTHSTVMIYHPALAYMGRDYGFEQVSFEDEGKNPSPARMKELIDLAREKEIKIIFIQAEYDVRNAQSLSRETGARLVVINPMNSDWPEAVLEVAGALGSRQ